MQSLVYRSDSSSEEAEGSECDLMAPLPLSCAYAAPLLVGPASSVGSQNSSCSLRKESCSPMLPRGSSSGELLGDMLGGVTNNPSAAYQEAVKVMSATKRSSSRSASGDEDVLSFIAKDVVAKGLDHDTFAAVNKVKSVRIALKGDALFPLFPREIKPKKLDTEPVRSQLRGDFLLGRDQAE
ncbi:hypothetical protein Bca52824_039593 [Brassica carinata]|uniref:Uncharacterized protein n=1 Tax=Brassica carinata TaxID=52824 RepID=A0A8X7RPN8_BRACI|nr:hypothetical protein Bca52824_039593 [Brassica carinata]